jgi:C4-dicarboxylate-specific signal transduction histidine kinase
VTQEGIAAIRTRAELARHLADQTWDAAAKAALLEIASMLDADAHRLEAGAQKDATKEIGDK